MTSKEFLLLKTELEFIKNQNEIKFQIIEKENASLRNEIEKLQKQNENFKQKLDEVSEKRSEQYYQRYLEKLLAASHQKTKHGNTDITTETQIIEIKHWRNYKNALGQLFSYKDSQINKNKSLAVYFFGSCSDSQKETVVQLFQQNEISVYEFIDTGDGVKVNQIHSHLGNEELELDKDSFENWLDQNIEYKEGKILKLEDVCTMFLGKKIGPRSKTKFKNMIEKFIKLKYPSVNFLYQDSKFNDNKYKGWLHFLLKNDFFNWLDQNVEYKKDSVLKLTDLCELYLNKKDIHSTESSKYKVDIEGWIKNQFPNIKNEYGIFKISGDQTVYRGWKHLQIKPNLVN